MYRKEWLSESNARGGASVWRSSVSSVRWSKLLLHRLTSAISYLRVIRSCGWWGVRGPNYTIMMPLLDSGHGLLSDAGRSSPSSNFHIVESWVFSLFFWPQLVCLHRSEELSGSLHRLGSQDLRPGMKAAVIAGVRVRVADRRDACRHPMRSRDGRGHSLFGKDAAWARLAKGRYSFRRRPSFWSRLHIYHNVRKLVGLVNHKKAAEVLWVRPRVAEETESRVWCVMNDGRVNHRLKKLVQQVECLGAGMRWAGLTIHDSFKMGNRLAWRWTDWRAKVSETEMMVCLLEKFKTTTNRIFKNI